MATPTTAGGTRTAARFRCSVHPVELRREEALEAKLAKYLTQTGERNLTAAAEAVRVY